MFIPSSTRLRARALCAVPLMACAGSVTPALADDAATETPRSRPLPAVTITAERGSAVPENTPAPTFGITADQLNDITVVNTEDALKYAPNLHVRKRFIGDNNAVVSVRSTSSRQSSHTLVYADGLLLSNLLGSDFGFPPRWSLVSTDEIQRVDVLYGPYSARFPGNSLGATVLISTAMPEQFEASANAQYFTQSFDQYGIDQSFAGHRESAFVGNRSGAWSWVVNFEHLESDGQPLSFFTANRSAVAAGAGDVPVTGAVAWTDQQGREGYLFGINSEGVTTARNDQIKLKVAYDISDTLQLAVTAVDWRQNFADATGSFLRAADGSLLNSGNVSIGGNRYTLPANAFAPANGESRRRLYGASLTSRNPVGWNYSLVASRFDTGKDATRTANAPGDGPGTVLLGDGSGWTTFDAQADLRPQRLEGAHWISFGAHGDAYKLDNRTFNTPDWRSNTPSSFNNAFAGKTETGALYLQDAWAFAPAWKLTPGLRYEHWRATDGVRSQGAVTLGYANRADSFWSPKLAIEREFGEQWNARLSLARAYRFPTVSELFQGRITGTALVNNDPNLKPEEARSKDITVERFTPRMRVRFSLYEDDLRDALFSQTNTTVFPTITNIQNVDRVRTRGAEVAVDATHVLLDGLDINASLARNHAKTLANANNPVSVGKLFYRIPDWRADVVGTYRWNRWVNSTLAARYSGRQFNTLDNSDINPTTFGGTSRYFVVDAKVALAFSKAASIGLGVDNLNDEKYFVYHPYPGRTFYADLKIDF